MRRFLAYLNPMSFSDKMKLQAEVNHSFFYQKLHTVQYWNTYNLKKLSTVFLLGFVPFRFVYHVVIYETK